MSDEKLREEALGYAYIYGDNLQGTIVCAYEAGALAERAKTKEKMWAAHILRDPHLTDPESPLYKYRMQQFEDWYEREGKL